MSKQIEWRVELEGTVNEIYYVFADNQADAIAAGKKEAEFDGLTVISSISVEKALDE